MGITGLRGPICANEPTEVTSTFRTANATLGESNAEFQTADTGLPRATRVQAAPDAKSR